MTDRTDRLLAVLVILIVLLVVSQTAVVPRDQMLGTIGLFIGAIAIVYTLAQILATY